MDSLPFAAKDAAMRHILYRGLGFEWNVDDIFLASWCTGSCTLCYKLSFDDFKSRCCKHEVIVYIWIK